MKKLVYFLLGSMFFYLSPVQAWQSDDIKGEQPIFLGTLSTQEGNKYNVTNIHLGRSRNSHDKIILYEKPQNLAPGPKGNMITVNPSIDLTTATLELQKIKSITVPEPQTIWKWTNEDSKRAVKMTYEYIEVIVTWQSGSSIHYLLELGPEDSRKPLKIFCDVVDKKLDDTKQQGIVLCQKIPKIDLRKKGAPLPSVHSLVLDEPCYRIPKENGGGMKATE